MKKNQTTLMIPVKPYVKHYLEINYGNPVDFSYHRHLYTHVRRMLITPKHRSDTVYSDKMKRFSTFVRVMISEDDVFRHGCEISKTDIVHFNNIFTYYIKFMMRTLVGLRVAMGGSSKEAIQKFQDRYGFTEDVWPYESIAKDFYRNGTPFRIEYEDEIFCKIEKIFMEKLSVSKDNFTSFKGFKKMIIKNEKDEQSDNF